MSGKQDLSQSESGRDVAIDTVELLAWFKKRPNWVQDAARRLFAHEPLTPGDIQELLVLCKRESGIDVVGYEGLTPKAIPALASTFQHDATTLRLDAIGDIKGINALAPRKPLQFGNEPLAVVYGGNGSGKSGYVRLLKHICGTPVQGQLLRHAFDNSVQSQSCTVTYTLGESQTACEWTPASGALDSLQGTSVYDSAAAHVYINDENKVAYEPALLRQFRALVETCKQVDKLLADEIAALPSAKPQLPVEFAQTEHGVWFSQLSRLTSGTDIVLKCSWNQELEAQLTKARERMAEASPSDKAAALRRTKAHVIDFACTIKSLEDAICDESFAKLQKLRVDATSKRHALEVDAKKVFENAPLEGVASESWRLLWQQARTYSEQVAYQGIAFPNIGGEAVCPLCQQILDDEAKVRLVSFEKFVQEGLQREATNAERTLDESIKSNIGPPDEKLIEERLDLCGIKNEAERVLVREHCHQLKARHVSFCLSTTQAQLPPMPIDGALTCLRALGQSIEDEIVAFSNDAQLAGRAELQRELRELEARKWVTEQCAAVKSEVLRLKQVNELDEAKKLTRTNSLSEKSGALALALVTPAFTKRFKDELKALGAKKVPVTIQKTRTVLGQAWHQIKLANCTGNTRAADVLSEGEYRIISIAAFLADMQAVDSHKPFVFDDPISSLDQDFEEFTAARLVELSSSRQVIVFTHRLSLLVALQDACKKASKKATVISLHKESWGAGEPDEPPIPAQSTEKALNTLINQRLSKARRVWEERGGVAYSVEATALCTDIRKTIERMIEMDLLADVIQRFRRPINTLGKLDKLARIKSDDCTFIDKMMTKYSLDAHSQPNEAPTQLPDPDELAEDLAELKAWRDEFTARSANA